MLAAQLTHSPFVNFFRRVLSTSVALRRFLTAAKRSSCLLACSASACSAVVSGLVQRSTKFVEQPMSCVQPLQTLHACLAHRCSRAVKISLINA